MLWKEPSRTSGDEKQDIWYKNSNNGINSRLKTSEARKLEEIPKEIIQNRAQIVKSLAGWGKDRISWPVGQYQVI